MASLWKHPKSRYWTACFTDKEGHRRKRSTKETSSKKAQAIADKMEQATRKKRTYTQLRDVLHELHAEITGEEIKSTSVRQYVESWLAEKKDETKGSSMQFYRSATTEFLKSLGDKADADIANVSRNQILEFRKSMAGKVSATTINHKLKCVKMLFKSARKEGAIPENPCDSVDTVRNDTAKERRPFTLKELQLVLAKADKEWKSMILFGLYSAQRLSDIASLTWGNIDLSKKEIRLTTAKTGRRMTIPMATPLENHLKSLKKPTSAGDPVHPRAFLTLQKVGKSTTLSNHFAKILAAAGLRKPVSHLTEKDGRSTHREQAELSFHCLRHTAVTLLKEASVPDAVIMAMVGHNSHQMNQRYTHVGTEALKKAATAMPNLKQARKRTAKKKSGKLKKSSAKNKPVQ